MNTREKLELMEDIKRKNKEFSTEYKIQCKRENREYYMDCIWQTCKGELIAVAVGILIGHIILWIAGC